MLIIFLIFQSFPFDKLRCIALGTMIFGRRLGCVVKEGTSKAETIHEFVQCIRQLFVESSKMIVLPARVASSLQSPVWKRFCTAAERALTLGKAKKK